MIDGSTAVRGARPRSPLGFRVALRDQALVAAGQLVCGVGNLAYALVMARVLAPEGFAELAAFLALFLLIYLPARSLSAGSALTPELAARARRRSLLWGVGISLPLLAAALPLSETLDLPPVLVAGLAVTPPLALLLALERGRLYGERAFGWVTGSLAAEPALRLATGIPLAASFGAAGGAAGVLAGSLGAWLVARMGGALRSPSGADAAPGDLARSRLAVGSFLFLALVQAQDVVYANAALPAPAAARFAVLSTLGGVAAFATTTIPLVMLPEARRRDRAALRAALAAAATLGVASVALVAVAPDLVLGLGFGDRYASLASLAVPYMGAMALLGVARVLAASQAAVGLRAVAWITALSAALQLGLLLAIGDSTVGVVTATLVATGALTAGLGLTQLRVRTAPPEPATLEPVAAGTVIDERPELEVEPEPEVDEEEPELEEAPEPRSRDLRAPLVLAGLMVIGVGLRLFADRSLWLDEATSWYQAELPFSAMLEVLRTTDVHPPLFHSILWVVVRQFGDGEEALRLPSLVAGTLLIPMLFVAGRALYDRRTGLIAATLGTAAPIVVWYSQEARMYGVMMLFAVIAVWALYQAMHTQRARYWPIYAAACAALVWTHYFALLLVLTLQVALVVMLWRRRRSGEPIAGLVVGAALATVAIAALLAPLVPFAYDQFTANEAAGRGFNQPTQAGANPEESVSLYGALANSIWALWGYHSDATMSHLVALWPVLMLGALLLLGRGSSQPTALLAALVAIPALLVTVIATQKPFLFELRYDLVAVPMLLMLAARAISTWYRGRQGRWILGGAVLVAMLIGLTDQALNGANPRIYDFEGALSRISSRAEPGDLLLYQPDSLNNVIDYYTPGVERRPLEQGLPAAPARKGEGGDTGAPGHVFVLQSFSDNLHNVQVVRSARDELDRQRELVGSFTVPQVRVWEYR